MATLTLTASFVNLIASGQSVSAQSIPIRGDDYEVPGESRLYAGGRRRSIIQAGQIATYTTTLMMVPTVDMTTLRSWAGQLVQIRDNLGRRFFGIYRKVPVVEVRGLPGTWDVTLVLDVLSIDEAV